MAAALTNYPDNKCVWGYMTVCDNCKDEAPNWVDTSKPIKEYLPTSHCEICGGYDNVPRSCV